MSNYKVSSRYAAAFLDMYENKDNFGIISEDMEFVEAAIESNKDLLRMLQNPVISNQAKASILKEIFESRISRESLEFLNFVVSKNRESLLYDIVKNFLQLKDEKQRIINVEVKTAFEFSEDQEDDLKTKLEKLINKKIRFRFMTDKSIVGGFVAKAGDTVYDASVSHQLNLLKKEFLSDNVSLN